MSESERKIWARVDEDGFFAEELIDFDPDGLFHEDLHFYPVPEELVGIIDGNFQWNGEYWDEPDRGYAQGKRDAITKEVNRKRLAEIDAQSLRALRAIVSGRGSEDDVAALASLETEAAYIRAHLEEL